jgi:hypothetical protein
MEAEMLSRSSSSVVFRVWFLALLGFLGLITCSLGVQSSFASLPQVPSGAWTLTGQMSQARTGAAAAVLQDGSVLLAGGTDASGNVLASAEIYGAGGVFQLTAAPMQVARTGHTATLLSDGRVLVAGGTTQGGSAVSSAEIYDPSAGTWTLLSATLAQARTGHTATPLANGDVLLAGGQNSSGALASLELFSAATETFSAAGAMSSPRSGHAAAALNDGCVLIAGGTDAGGATLGTTDIYDPKTGTVTSGPALNTPRAAATATTLLDGTVLIAGGRYPEGAQGGAAELPSAEIFDPLAGTIMALTPTLSYARAGQLAFLLPHNNNVLLDGGVAGAADLASAELYTPWLKAFSLTGAMNAARSQAAGGGLWPLADGLLLVAGGSNLATAELYGFPTVETDKSQYAPGEQVSITGSGWLPAESVTLSLVKSPAGAPIAPLYATADAMGNITAAYTISSSVPSATYYLTAVGGTSNLQAQAMFSDAAPFISVDCEPYSFPVNNPAVCTVSLASHSTCTPQDGTTITWSSSQGNFSATTCALSGLSCAVSFTPTTWNNVLVQATYPATTGCAPAQDGEPLDIQSTNPVPATTGISPGSVYVASGAFTLTVNGTNFETGSWVTFNGAARATTYQSGTQLTAAILATDVSSSGTFSVVVMNQSPGGGPSNPQTFAVYPLTPTLTVTCPTGAIYNGSQQPCSGSATGLGGITVSGSFSFSYTGTGSTTYGPTNIAPTAAGTYSALGTFTSTNNNYTSGGQQSAAFQIGQASLTVTADNQSMTYGGSIPPLTCTIGGAVTGDTFGCTFASVVPAGTNPTHAGSPYTIVPIGITGTNGANAANYTVTYYNGQLTVGPATLTVTADNKSITYGAGAPSPTCTITGAAFNDTFSCTFAPIVPAGTNPTHVNSPYTITLTGVSGTNGTNLANYTVNTGNGQLTVGAAALTVTADNKSMTYGGSIPALTCTIVGAEFSDTFSCTYASVVSAGTYPTYVNSPYAIDLTGVFGTNGTNLANYTVTLNNGRLSVGQASLTVTADNKSMTYGATIPALTCTVTGQVNGDGFTCTFAPIVPAGVNPTVAGSPWTITPTAAVGANAANYTVAYNNGALKVTQASQTISCNQPGEPANTLPYVANPVSPCTSSALDALPVTYTAASGNASRTTDDHDLILSGPGMASLIATQPGDSNYKPAPPVTWTFKVTWNRGVISCNYSSSSVTPASGPGLPASVTYGIAPISFSCTSTAPGPLYYAVRGTGGSLVNGLLTITAAKPVSVTVSQPAYDFYLTSLSKTYAVTVDPAPLTLVAPPGISLLYGLLLPSSSYACTVAAPGMVSPDKPNPAPKVTSTVTKTSPLGTYPVNCSVHATSKPYSNYSINYVAGVLTYQVNPAAITLNHPVVNFPQTAVGSSSGVGGHPFTLTNETGTEVQFTVIPPSENFSVTPASCSAATGTSCTFVAVFQPQSLGVHTEALTISASDAANDTLVSKTVTLHGIGKK